MTTGQVITGSRREGPITVIGATGQQGGAVVDALLEHRVPLRAVTRNPNGDKARALAARGVEVVRADLEDVDSVPVEIAGDELTGDQIAGRLAHRIGSPTTYAQLPSDALGVDVDLKMMFGWLGRLPAYQADFARTRELAGGVEDPPGWLARVDGLPAGD
jgi:NAD(P)-dependent dehydrogenase (short-subunit alcohol dehydrogenase family)